MEKRILVNMDIWFLTKPDADEYKEMTEKEIMKQIEYLAKENNITLTWYWDTRDTGFGLERYAFVEGYNDDLNRFLKQVNDWV
jgi:hypothetical protein